MSDPNPFTSFTSMFIAIIVLIVFMFVPTGNEIIEPDYILTIGDVINGYEFTGFTYIKAWGGYSYKISFIKESTIYEMSFTTSPKHFYLPDYNFTLTDYDKDIMVIGIANDHKEIKTVCFMDLLYEMMKRVNVK